MFDFLSVCWSQEKRLITEGEGVGMDLGDTASPAPPALGRDTSTRPGSSGPYPAWP